jgi:hypothetical protein
MRFTPFKGERDSGREHQPSGGCTGRKAEQMEEMKNSFRRDRKIVSVSAISGAVKKGTRKCPILKSNVSA